MTVSLRSRTRAVVPVVALLTFALGGCARRAPAPTPAPAAAPTPAPAAGASRDSVAEAGLGRMWTFDRPPLEHLEAAYGFEPDEAWLDHVRLSSLRVGEICSASFVSPDGLVMTNHHCARECITAASPADTDYLATGFYARSIADEPRCEGLYLDQLVSIRDVTASVDSAVSPTTSDAEASRARDDAMGRIEASCRSETRRVCSVVALYQGGVYSLYEYRRYDDVRLVFSPEEGIASFGGDPDNFTYPRYDLDVSFLRAFENGGPARTKDYFQWSEAGADEGEPVFVTGNPGSTQRLATVAQLQYLRDAAYPTLLRTLRDRLQVLQELERPSDANEIFELQNSVKLFAGMLKGLHDPDLMARKRSFEDGFRGAVDRDATLRDRYGDAWDRIARTSVEQAQIDTVLRLGNFRDSRLMTLAEITVGYIEQLALPDSARDPLFREANRRRLEGFLYARIPIDTAYEERFLRARLTAARDLLGPDSWFVRAALQGLDPDSAAGRLVRGSRVADPSFRRELAEGGRAALDSTRDPTIVFERTIDPRLEELGDRARDLAEVESTNAARIGRALFAVYGTQASPDGTFTLRLSDGTVKGYPMNGTRAPYKTTLFGLYGRAAAFDGREPWRLPERWEARRSALDLSTPLDFVCTCDIVGGNSGSPVIDRDAKIVGLIFDGNIESLPNSFLYTEHAARAVAVHSRALIEALRKVYDAVDLVDELQGRAAVRSGT